MRALVVLVSLLLAVVILSSLAYIRIMFDGAWTPESIVEALNFSVQTVTTVGYGNWEPPGIANKETKVFWVKTLSLPVMLVGAALFAASIAVAIELFRR